MDQVVAFGYKWKPHPQEDNTWLLFAPGPRKRKPVGVLRMELLHDRAVYNATKLKADGVVSTTEQWHHSPMVAIREMEEL